jgi:erlin
MLELSLAVFGILSVIITSQGLHQVHEGHVGVYYRGGAIIPGITEPGWHTKMPMVTSYSEVQVTVQTDKVNNVPCGTSGGTMIKFD